MSWVSDIYIRHTCNYDRKPNWSLWRLSTGEHGESGRLLAVESVDQRHTLGLPKPRHWFNTHGPVAYICRNRGPEVLLSHVCTKASETAGFP